MTDLMLDQLLAESREPEPMDDAFVRAVMGEVHAHEQRRWRLRLVRRPVVFGVAAAVLATSGAVAALVGTHVPQKEAAIASNTPGVAHVSVSAAPRASASNVAVPSASSAVTPSGSPATKVAGHWGFPSLHTAWVVDDVTGLKLTTETYTNDFRAGKAQKVTLTILNTSSNPLVVSGMTSCALQVIATPAGGRSLAPACGSGGVTNDSIVLAPGGFFTANADVTLPTSGKWNIVGRCTCAYSNPTQNTITSKTNAPFGALLDRSAPPLVPAKNGPDNGTATLLTPAIGVVSSR
jgi:hypothetical protein